VENVQVISEGILVNNFLRLEQYIFRITIIELRSLILKVVELNHLPHTPNKDRNRWKNIALWVHEKTPTTKFEAATC
jgi:hypothetical protein